MTVLVENITYIVKVVKKMCKLIAAFAFIIDIEISISGTSASFLIKSSALSEQCQPYAKDHIFKSENAKCNDVFEQRGFGQKCV